MAIVLPGVRRLNRRVWTNIHIAFPDWDATRRQKMYRLFWKSQIYTAIFESPIISAPKYAGLISQLKPGVDAKHAIARWQGLEHVEATRDYPVIFTLAHMHSLEIAIIATCALRPVHYMPKDTKDKFIARVIGRNRALINCAGRVNHDDMRGSHRCLSSGGSITAVGD